jgi:hypothetical protein
MTKTPAADTPHSSNQAGIEVAGTPGRTLSADDLASVLLDISSNISTALYLVDDELGAGTGSNRLGGAAALLAAAGAKCDRLSVALGGSAHDEPDGWLLGPAVLDAMRRIEGGK